MGSRVGTTHRCTEMIHEWVGTDQATTKDMSIVA